MSDIEQKVKEIIVDKLTVDENEVTPQAEFNKDLGADSLDTVELIMEFEKAFNLTIPDRLSVTPSATSSPTRNNPSPTDSILFNR